MVLQVRPCPHWQGTDIVRHGLTRQGKPRDRCRACPEHGRTWLLAYASAGQSPPVQPQIVERAMPASGRRDTVRVLPVSPPTGLQA
jgi:transposase-like protein